MNTTIFTAIKLNKQNVTDEGFYGKKRKMKGFRFTFFSIVKKPKMITEEEDLEDNVKMDLSLY